MSHVVIPSITVYLSYTSTGQTTGGREGTLTADGRQSTADNQRDDGGESGSSTAGQFT